MRRSVSLAHALLGACAAWFLYCGIARCQDAASPPPPPGTGAAVAVSAAAEPELDTPQKVTLLQLLHKGGFLMYPLYLCSILMVAFGIERAINLRRKKVLPPSIVSRIRDVIDDTEGAFERQALLNDIQADPSPISHVVAAGLRRAGKPVAELEKAIQYAGERESAGLRRNNRVLAVVASVSPLLGLLGTVFGMIQAFVTVAGREEALGRTELLAEGIYQALVTTAAGLSIAIPAMVLYHIYVEKVDRLVSEMDDIATQLVERLASES